MTRSLLSKIVVSGLISAVAGLAQYKAEPTGAPPSDVPAAFASTLEKQGTKITGPDGEVADIWLVATAPQGAPSGEMNVTLPKVPHGSLMGVISFPKGGKDRRGQQVKPGVYTVRYSMFPINGDHQGVAPQRDFFLMTKMSDDTDPKATPNFDTLMGWSKKAAGTPHPLVMSIWKADDQLQNFTELGEDWVLQRKMGDVNLAIVVVGTASA